MSRNNAFDQTVVWVILLLFISFGAFLHEGYGVVFEAFILLHIYCACLSPPLLFLIALICFWVFISF